MTGRRMLSGNSSGTGLHPQRDDQPLEQGPRRPVPGTLLTLRLRTERRSQRAPGGRNGHPSWAVAGQAGRTKPRTTQGVKLARAGSWLGVKAATKHIQKPENKLQFGIYSLSFLSFQEHFITGRRVKIVQILKAGALRGQILPPIYSQPAGILAKNYDR